MAFNIRQYLGLVPGVPGSIYYDNYRNPLPTELLDRIDRDVNELISRVVGANRPKPNRPPPTTEAEFHTELRDFIEDEGHVNISPELLRAISRKAVELLKDPTASLNSPEQLAQRSKLALYDVVLYCDDSYSMQLEAGRIEAQRTFAQRVAKIMLPFALNEDDSRAGIHLRFINDNRLFDNLMSPEDVAAALNVAAYNGYTPIGTMLKTKILKPMLYDKLEKKPTTFDKPLLIIVITDGWPYNEDPDLFKNTITDTMRYLEDVEVHVEVTNDNGETKITKERMSNKAVLYQVNQIGHAPEAEAFIESLINETKLKPIMHCTSEKLDDKIKELKDNEEGLDNWLYDIIFEGDKD